MGMGGMRVRRERWRVDVWVVRAWMVVVSVGVGGVGWERRRVVQCVRRVVWWFRRRRRGLVFGFGFGCEERRAVSRRERRVGARTGGGFVMLVGLGLGEGRGGEGCLSFVWEDGDVGEEG